MYLKGESTITLFLQGEIVVVILFNIVKHRLHVCGKDAHWEVGDLAGDSEAEEPGPCTALSRATLVDQDSGEVYQVSSLVQTCCVMLCYVEMLCQDDYHPC